MRTTEAAGELVRPRVDGPLPAVPLRHRLRVAQWPRRVIPTWLAVRYAAARGLLAWRRHDVVRTAARLAMLAIVAGTPREAEAERLARESVAERRVIDELLWRPWAIRRIEASEPEHLRQALAPDRGTLVSTIHQGAFFSGTTLLSKYGARPYSVAGPWLLAPSEPGLWGRRAAHWRRVIGRSGATFIRSTGSFAVIEDLLRRGERVLLAWDMPGGTETPFLGKQVMVSGGSARLAHRTDALVLPVTYGRRGGRIVAITSPPLDPRDFATPEDLHRALAAVHERRILERPEALEDPRRAGAWEDGATPERWARPERPAA